MSVDVIDVSRADPGIGQRRLDRPRQAIPIMLLAVGRQGEKGVYNPRLRFPLEQQVIWR